MNIWIRNFALSFCASLVYSANAEVTEERKEEFRKLMQNYILTFGGRTESQYYGRWITELNTEERAALIPIVREHRDKVDSRMPALREDWNGVLAYLGDEEAMKENIEHWRNRPDEGFDLEVMRAESGQLPLYLEPELFINETHVAINNDAGYRVEKSFGIALGILDYLKYNKHYSQDVRDWASRTKRAWDHREDPTPLRRVTRDWYRANEAFIRAKEYDKVRPGEDLPPLPSTLNGVGLSIPPQPITDNMRHQDTAPTPKPRIILKPTAAQPAVEPESHSSVNYALLVALFSLLTALAIIFRHRLIGNKSKAP